MHISSNVAASLLLPLTVSASWQNTFGRLSSNSFGVPGVNATYDYIVVGGGTAGNVMAARLAQNGTFSVAVIEAGSFYQLTNGNGSVIPGLAITQHTGTDPSNKQPLIDWDFVTTPQAVGGHLCCQTIWESC
jgi:choline dehydrogenase